MAPRARRKKDAEEVDPWSARVPASYAPSSTAFPDHEAGTSSLRTAPSDLLESNAESYTLRRVYRLYGAPVFAEHAFVLLRPAFKPEVLPLYEFLIHHHRGSYTMLDNLSDRPNDNCYLVIPTQREATDAQWHFRLTDPANALHDGHNMSTISTYTLQLRAYIGVPIGDLKESEALSHLKEDDGVLPPIPANEQRRFQETLRGMEEFEWEGKSREAFFEWFKTRSPEFGKGTSAFCRKWQKHFVACNPDFASRCNSRTKDHVEALGLAPKKRRRTTAPTKLDAIKEQPQSPLHEVSEDVVVPEPPMVELEEPVEIHVPPSPSPTQTVDTYHRETVGTVLELMGISDYAPTQPSSLSSEDWRAVNTAVDTRSLPAPGLVQSLLDDWMAIARRRLSDMAGRHLTVLGPSFFPLFDDNLGVVAAAYRRTLSSIHLDPTQNRFDVNQTLLVPSQQGRICVIFTSPQTRQCLIAIPGGGKSKELREHSRLIVNAVSEEVHYLDYHEEKSLSWEFIEKLIPHSREPSVAALSALEIIRTVVRHTSSREDAGSTTLDELVASLHPDKAVVRDEESANAALRLLVSEVITQRIDLLE